MTDEMARSVLMAELFKAQAKFKSMEALFDKAKHKGWEKAGHEASSETSAALGAIKGEIAALSNNNKKRYKLEIAPDSDKRPTETLVFVFKTIQELIAAENTAASVLLTKRESNAFIKYKKVNGDWEEME